MSENVYEKEPVLKRAFMFVEDGDWQRAYQYFERVLDMDPECAQAYLGLLMVETRVKKQEDLINCVQSFENLDSYQKVLRFGDEDLKKTLQEYIEYIKTRNINLGKENLYNRGIALMNSAKNHAEFMNASQVFNSVKDYKDSEALAKKCVQMAEGAKNDVILANGKSSMSFNTVDGYNEAIRLFGLIPGWKEADELAENCRNMIEELNKQAEYKKKQLVKKQKTFKKFALIACVAACFIIAFVIVLNTVIIPGEEYKKAVSLMNDGKYEQAIEAFGKLDGYKDSEEKVILCKKNIIKESDVGDYITFGSYEQDNNLNNGKEEIEWLVLDKEGDRALLISRYGLDWQHYNEEDEGVTWETCTLRSWLNDEFLNSAFSQQEKTMIPTVTVEAHENPVYDINPGNDTMDKVFLLSVEEAEDYFSSDNARKCELTDYAVDKTFAYVVDWWWLRSPGYRQDTAAFVDDIGSVDYSGAFFSYSANAVRPALWVNLESSQESGFSEVAVPSQESAFKDDVQIGDYITFGKYEQDNNLSNGKEEIEWLVLDKEGDRALLISRYGLDWQPYNEEYEDVTWETCTLRSWLNNEFLYSAFSSEEREMIPTVTVEAHKNPIYDVSSGNSTNDKVFLLSITEAYEYFDSDKDWICKPTAYAVEKSFWIYHDGGKCTWWLRSPGYNQNYAACVVLNGSVDYDDDKVNNCENAVRPVLWVNLES